MHELDSRINSISRMVVVLVRIVGGDAKFEGVNGELTIQSLGMLTFPHLEVAQSASSFTTLCPTSSPTRSILHLHGFTT